MKREALTLSPVITQYVSVRELLNLESLKGIKRRIHNIDKKQDTNNNEDFQQTTPHVGRSCLPRAITTSTSNRDWWLAQIR